LSVKSLTYISVIALVIALLNLKLPLPGSALAVGSLNFQGNETEAPPPEVAFNVIKLFPLSTNCIFVPPLRLIIFIESFLVMFNVLALIVEPVMLL
jgi:hypothetical protein